MSFVKFTPKQYAAFTGKGKPKNRGPKIPRPPSPGEEALAAQLAAHKIPFEREVKFSPGRRYRLDFVLKRPLRITAGVASRGLAVEVDGGLWNNGRHIRPAGVMEDMRKLNLAAKEGYIVLRYATDMIKSGEAIIDIMEQLK